MRKIAIEDLIQLLGVVGIIGSLIFVGLEMRQSQRIALAAQVQARAEMQTDRLLSSIERNIDGYTLFTDANYSFAALTEEEKQVAEEAGVEPTKPVINRLHRV